MATTVPASLPVLVKSIKFCSCLVAVLIFWGLTQQQVVSVIIILNQVVLLVLLFLFLYFYFYF